MPGAEKGHSSAALRRDRGRTARELLQKADWFQLVATTALFLLSGLA
jgi:hypothetical protein